MQVINFRDEAEKIGIPIESVRMAYEKGVKEGKITGVFIPKKSEFIRFKPRELGTLVNNLKGRVVSLESIASELNLLTYQAVFLFDYLLKTGKLKGIVTNDWRFISKLKLIELMIDELEKTGKIDTLEISNKLMTNRESIDLFLDELSKQIIEEVTPYGQIKLEDLASEVKLPQKFTEYLVKNLVRERKIYGQIDKVNNILIINNSQIPFYSSTEKVEFREKPLPKKNRSDWWCLVPIFFGLLGGIISYAIFEKDDPDTARNLFWLGFILSLLSGLVLWVYWSRIFSLFW